MYQTGQVVSAAAFASWIARQKRAKRPNRSTCRRTPRTTSRSRCGGPADRAPRASRSARGRPLGGGCSASTCSRDRARHRRLLPRRTGSATRSRAGKDYLIGTDQNDVAHLHGLPVRRRSAGSSGSASSTTRSGGILGRPPTLRDEGDGGVERYFRLCTDHKVVGIQYFFGVGSSSSSAGLNAMFIRAELLTPNEQAWPAGQYISLVGLHGTMMMMMTSASPRAVRELLRPAHDRRAADGVPAHRGADVLARCRSPGSCCCRRSRSAASRPAGPATRRSPTRRARGWTPTSRVPADRPLDAPSA